MPSNEKENYLSKLKDAKLHIYGKAKYPRKLHNVSFGNNFSDKKSYLE